MVGNLDVLGDLEVLEILVRRDSIKAHMPWCCIWNGRRMDIDDPQDRSECRERAWQARLQGHFAEYCSPLITIN